MRYGPPIEATPTNRATRSCPRKYPPSALSIFAPSPSTSARRSLGTSERTPDPASLEHRHDRVEQEDQDDGESQRREHDPDRVQQVPEGDVGEERHADGRPGQDAVTRCARHDGVRNEWISPPFQARLVP